MSMMTAKLKQIALERRRKKGLKASTLKKLNQEYLDYYEGMSHDQMITMFLRQVEGWLKHDLEEKEYLNNPSSPQEHLIDLAKVGTFSVFIFHGYLPEKYQELV